MESFLIVRQISLTLETMSQLIKGTFYPILKTELMQIYLLCLPILKNLVKIY